MPAETQQKKFAAAVVSALRLRGMTMRELAQQLGVHRNSVGVAVNRGEFPRVVESIRAELGLPAKPGRGKDA